MSDEPIDLDPWEPQLPPSDFADRVLARVGQEPKRKRRWPVVAGGLAALALAAAALLRITAAPARGEAIAADRIEVAVGKRAVAVLEPGASLSWNGDDIAQPRGDVFYRVEPGARFIVHTPAGDVEVKGTCFTVKVRPIGETSMQKRDVKTGAVGALAALALVAVYEGKVALSHASDRIELRAGEAAQAGPDGVKRSNEQSFAQAVTADDSNGAANQNLVRQVSEYRRRLEAITAQKADLEAKLKRSEANLASAQDGSVPAPKHEFDLSADDWKELAKDGAVKYQLPCDGPKGDPWSPSPEQLNALGLSPDDGKTIGNAYAHSNDRIWSAIKPLCAQAIGNADIAEKLGRDTCTALVLDMESTKNRDAARRAMHEVGEIRAGLRPMPGANDPVNPVLKVFLAQTGEVKAFEAELAQSFGAEEAHRIVYSDELCMGASTFAGSRGPRPKN